MTNMSYCRFENTLRDMRDCYEQLKAMANADEFDSIGQHNQPERAARVAFIEQVLEMATMLRSEIESPEGELTKDDIEQWVIECEDRDTELRRFEED